MYVIANGKQVEVEEGTLLSGLLETLGMPGERVAVERNREIVPRGDFASTALEDGDSLEIVQFVGGG